MIGPGTPGSGRVAFSYRGYRPHVYPRTLPCVQTCLCVSHDSLWPCLLALRNCTRVHMHVTAAHSCAVKHFGVFRLTQFAH